MEVKAKQPKGLKRQSYAVSRSIKKPRQIQTTTTTNQYTTTLCSARTHMAIFKEMKNDGDAEC